MVSGLHRAEYTIRTVSVHVQTASHARIGDAFAWTTVAATVVLVGVAALSTAGIVLG